MPFADNAFELVMTVLSIEQMERGGNKRSPKLPALPPSTF